MKRLLPLLALCALSFSPPVEDYSLYEALANSLVEANIEVNKNSTHYHKPFEIGLKNRSKRPLNIRIDNGTKLEPNNQDFQNFTTVKEEILALSPAGSKKRAIRAMCMEAHDRAPSASSAYHFNGKTKEKMLGLTKLIEEKELYSYMAQDAVWALADGESARSISGYHYTDGFPLVEYVAKVNGEEVPPPPSEDDYSRNFRSSNSKVTVGGAFTFKAGFPMDVEFGLFNEEGTVVRELFNNQNTPPGEHRVEYSFDHSVYTDDFYSVKMIADGEIFLQNRFSFNPEDWRD